MYLSTNEKNILPSFILKNYEHVLSKKSWNSEFYEFSSNRISLVCLFFVTFSISSDKEIRENLNSELVVRESIKAFKLKQKFSWNFRCLEIRMHLQKWFQPILFFLNAMTDDRRYFWTEQSIS